MSLSDAVATELAGQEGWQVEMAKALAAEVADNGSASAAKELRVLMAELGASSAKPAATEETGLSDFERRLREREAAAARRAASA